MNVRTAGKTLAAAAVFAVSLSACGNTLPAPQPVGNTGGGNVSSQTSDSSSSTSDSAGSYCTNQWIDGEFRLATTGRTDGYLTITNVGTETCTVSADYPSMEFTGRDATPIENVVYTQGASPTGTVTLAPGEQATSDIEWQMEADNSTPCSGPAWALNLSVDGKSTPKSVEPEGGETFGVCGPEVLVGGWNKA